MATEPDVLAALQVLVAVAKADGKLAPEEVRALESALEDQPQPMSWSVERLLSEDVDLDRVLASVTATDVRQQTFAAAAAMAMADQEVAPEELALLHKIQLAWDIPDEVAALSKRMAAFVEPVASEAPPPEPSIDPAKAEAEAKRLTYGYAVGSIALGAFPIPGVSIIADVLTVVLQRRLIDQVARAHGKQLTGGEVAAAYGAMAGLAAVRIAVVSVMKLIPVWGWVVGGASAFVTTWGVGMAVHANLARGGNLSADELKADFQAAKAEGKKHFDENKSKIEADAKERSQKIAELTQAMQDGKISREELEEQVAALG